MEFLESDQLKQWREKLGISQKRFAELAGMSLTTLRQFEVGSHKPQKKTLKKLAEVMQGVENGSLSKDDLNPPRKRRKDAKAVLVTAKPAAAVKPVSAKAPTESAPATAPKRRGRPPKAKSGAEVVAPKAAPVPAPGVAKKPRAPWGSKSGRLTKAQKKAQAAAAPAPVASVTPPAQISAPAPAASAPASVAAGLHGMGAIQLSNLDLELINRILNMSGREKLALLERLM